MATGRETPNIRPGRAPNARPNPSPTRPGALRLAGCLLLWGGALGGLAGLAGCQSTAPEGSNAPPGQGAATGGAVKEVWRDSLLSPPPTHRITLPKSENSYDPDHSFLVVAVDPQGRITGVWSGGPVFGDRAARGCLEILRRPRSRPLLLSQLPSLCKFADVRIARRGAKK